MKQDNQDAKDNQNTPKITIESIAKTIFSNYDKDDYNWFL